jgi:aminopeptidase N
MHRLANTKGFILLDMLSRIIGRERFAEILRKFIRGKNNQLTSWQEFQKFVEANAKQDVRWFFEQWFERTGAPDYQLEWNQKGKKLYGEIKQTEPYFRAALEVEIKGARRRLIKTIEVRNGKTEFNWAVPFRIESVILDPDYKVLRWLPEFQR